VEINLVDASRMMLQTETDRCDLALYRDQPGIDFSPRKAVVAELFQYPGSYPKLYLPRCA